MYINNNVCGYFKLSYSEYKAFCTEKEIHVVLGANGYVRINLLDDKFCSITHNNDLSKLFYDGLLDHERRYE